ncbi:MAG: sodium:proton antiporter [Flavobacteriales bacterium]|uniref:SLC13 family permease n=1 Tax=Blattabacterium sp. (Mastotermes darwiniensis) TaxID=39768 RepID=UPI000231DE57|nr:SLC13 family permease [Blattabacterium sp. (Mastotermes darwiniensis)]AER40651.1 putative Na+/H+ antiporter [Blattabacterium sp. (Mastotermes darwiniensis) str. MADAR]MDR1804821.1 sodium:proton antiporter [Flavobacteriales bacterium]
MIILVFIIGYLFITIEDFVSINKVIPSILMATICWSLIMFWNIPVFELSNRYLIKCKDPYHLLLIHLGKASEIVFFLVGAMSMISIMDMYYGFEALRVLFYSNTNTKRKFLWIISLLSFLLSAIIDNLTATIIIITILKKIIVDYKERWYYLGLIIISANAGGVWSPIGDITTTMLWITNKVTTINLVKKIFIPSVLCMCISTFIGSLIPIFDGYITMKKIELSKKDFKKGLWMLKIGLFLMLLVPLFKTITGIPPYMGMMFSFGILCLITNIYYKNHFSMNKVFKKLDFSSILFFLGILLSISSLESLGILYNLSYWINHTVTSWKITTFIFGLISSVIDNVPLVAAVIAMFSYPIDHEFWHFITYISGTGGSIFLIGSSSGITAMGMEKIDFFWYLKKISWLALIGYLTGFIYLLLIDPFFSL